MPDAVPPCPQCHSSAQVVRILYGMPTYEAFEAAERGEFVLGGCMVSYDSLVWHCKTCGEGFGLRVPSRGAAEEHA